MWAYLLDLFKLFYICLFVVLKVQFNFKNILVWYFYIFEEGKVMFLNIIIATYHLDLITYYPNH